MTISDMLSFSLDAMSEYVQSGVFQYVFVPLLAFASVIMCLRVVKFICTI